MLKVVLPFKRNTFGKKRLGTKTQHPWPSFSAVFHSNIPNIAHTLIGWKIGESRHLLPFAWKGFPIWTKSNMSLTFSSMRHLPWMRNILVISQSKVQKLCILVRVYSTEVFLALSGWRWLTLLFISNASNCIGWRSQSTIDRKSPWKVPRSFPVNHSFLEYFKVPKNKSVEFESFLQNWISSCEAAGISTSKSES